MNPETAHRATFEELVSQNGAGPAVSADADSSPRTTWAPIDLDPVLAGDRSAEPPSILARTDGKHLMYAGKSHGISAESESGKTLMALRTAAAVMEEGGHVTYVDFEGGPETIVSRLLDLAVTPEAIREQFHYVRPDEPISEDAWNELDPFLDAIDLAVIDGVTEGLTLHGLDLADNTDIAKWLKLIVRPLQRRGAAVLQLDHVTKDRESRGRYAIGAQHKLAGIDVAFSLRVAETFGRGVSGSVRVNVEKDRPGYLRAAAVEKTIAVMHVESLPGGALEISFEPPSDDEAGPFRPTVLMEKVSELVEREPGLTKSAIETAAAGKAKTIRLAVELLTAEGFVDMKPEGQAQRHYSVRRFYRGAERVET